MFSELMDSQSLFVTANCDTIYFVGFIDLSDGRWSSTSRR
jgi:hypothetical protein